MSDESEYLEIFYKGKSVCRVKGDKQTLEGIIDQYASMKSSPISVTTPPYH